VAVEPDKKIDHILVALPRDVLMGVLAYDEISIAKALMLIRIRAKRKLHTSG